MKQVIDLTNQRFGSWIVLQRAGTYRGNGHTIPTWLCRCDCGTYSVVLGNNLRSGKSVGCKRCRTDKMLGGLREYRADRRKLKGVM